MNRTSGYGNLIFYNANSKGKILKIVDMCLRPLFIHIQKQWKLIFVSQTQKSYTDIQANFKSFGKKIYESLSI